MTPKQLREDKGWRQVDVASKAGVGLSTVQRAESGDPVSMVNLKSLAEVFGITTGEMADAVESVRTA